MGAIANAIRQLDRSRFTGDLIPLSFFGGDLGVACAACVIEACTGSSELGAAVDAILDRVARAIGEPHLLEVIWGTQAQYPPLSRWAGRIRWSCHELATALGEELCRTAIREGPTCAWDPEATAGPGVSSTLLTGLSHGAAGIGLALFELHAATGRPEFLETARGAFAYEDTFFDPRENNWRNLRSSPRLLPFARAWCHGAPGIALARMRAATLDPECGEHHLAMARGGIATTIDAIGQFLATPRYDATPCHGLTGLIEIVWIAGRMLDDASYASSAVEPRLGS